MDAFRGMDPLLQARVAGGFTWAMTALGAALVLFTRRAGGGGRAGRGAPNQAGEGMAVSAIAVRGGNNTLRAEQVEGEIQLMRRATGWNAVGGFNLVVRWTIAELLVDLGRDEEAIPYFQSIRYDPYAALELGKVYEELGRRGEAKEQYEIVLAYWRSADPELAPRIAEARQRIAGLGFQPRT